MDRFLRRVLEIRDREQGFAPDTLTASELQAIDAERMRWLETQISPTRCQSCNVKLRPRDEKLSAIYCWKCGGRPRAEAEVTAPPGMRARHRPAARIRRPAPACS